MKKIGSIVFTLALFIGLAFSTNCSFGNFSQISGVQGSGISKTETRNIKGFKKIEANGALSVEIAAQKDFSVEIEADDNLLPNIKTETNGDTLKIYSEDRISPKAPIKVKISMPAIEGLDITGASSGIVTNVKAETIELKANGASKITVSGDAESLEADANGASSINAENLKVQDVDVQANGASSATVTAANDLKADANGASKIYYVGEPKNIKQNSSGASSISKK